MSARVHRYEARTRWTGSTGLGWEGYDRAHTSTAPPAEPALTLTTGEDKGDPRLLNPEQLVLMAASSCQLLWFLHLAAKARIDVLDYVDEASAEMPEDDPPVRLTKITLRPRITVAKGPSQERVLKLLQQAHEHCYIANSLRSSITLQSSIEFK
jgi:organic hydroperoxide reductase OsmC/OhrA